MIAAVLVMGLVGAGLLLYMYKEANADRVLYQEVTFPNFPKSFGEVKIFFISDIHKRVITSNLLNQVKDKVDMVIIGGDLLEKGVPLERVEENIKKLRELGIVYFVWGNNDYEADQRIIDALLLKYGVKILDNTAVSFESEEGDRFILLGVDDMTKGRERLHLALQDAGDEGFKVLVSHNPKIIDKVNETDRISFVLSGHTHGGQIRLLGFSPYEKGKIEKYNKCTLLVSNGYGTTALPFRLGAKAETHFITIKYGDE
ncbi:metallophosphoesterase [Bacillus dakarensis]|uniref:metallophosphoesterase n=1 Tax=Robertmurraya dakarensis TaxID=1926278 RepID=UPI0009825EF6|nr:metallophosphoesterase [Bacillus dakarensis]